MLSRYRLNAPIADTKDGLYVLHAVRAQPFSQPANMYIQRTGPNPTTVPPDAHQEDLSRNDLSGVLHQQQKQPATCDGSSR